MRIIVAGSREDVTLSDVEKALKESGWNPTVILSGTAIGADRFGEAIAKQRNIALERYPADWSQYGKSAGYKRNVQMAERADALVAVWNGSSKGTKHMIDIATAKGLKVYVHQVRD